MDTMQFYRNPHEDDVRQHTEVLAGAFAEGIDLGSRGAQIRDLGRALETAIDALRSKLVELNGELQFDTELLRLNQLTRMARIAQAYGTD